MPKPKRKFTHRKALQVCHKAAMSRKDHDPTSLSDIEALYLFVAAFASRIPPQFVLLRRYHIPKPSAEAREQILAAVAKLARNAEQQNRALSAGFTLKEISAALQDSYTYSTLRNYVSKLAAAGDLIRVAEGVYQLPSKRA